MYSDAVCVHALKGLALLRASHSSEIALADSRRLHAMIAAAPVLFTHTAVTDTIIGGATTSTMIHVDKAGEEGVETRKQRTSNAQHSTVSTLVGQDSTRYRRVPKCWTY